MDINQIEKQVMDYEKKFEAYRKKTKRNWINAEIQKKLKMPNVTNEMRSMVEVHQFKKNPPEKYFAYIQNSKPNKVTTWVGDPLGDITWMGREYSGGMGSVRQNLRIKAITGDIYSGTYFKSSGDYVRLKKLKQKLRGM